MKGQCFCSVQKKRMRGVRGKRLDPALKGLMGEANLRYTANTEQASGGGGEHLIPP